MLGWAWRLSLLPELAVLLIAASSAGQDDAAVAKAQLPVARSLAKEAKVIVAVSDPVVVPVDPAEQPMRTQNFTVRGIVAECFKGTIKPPSSIQYTITAEGRPAKLSQSHIAFLRSGTHGRWIAVDGPVFRDSPQMRRGLSKILNGCHQ